MADEAVHRAVADALAALPEGPVVCAVSGGSDSLALLHCLADIARAADGLKLVAATVDHGLRPESSAEAETVAGIAAGLGIPHRILPWTGEKPTSDVQNAARTARLRLLAAFARQEMAVAVLTGHTMDDLAETVLLRLARGSGVDGLAAIPDRSTIAGVPFVRPLLGVARAALREMLQERGAAWIDDPANADLRYARARMRAIMPQLAAEGLTVERLAATARRLARARDGLVHATATRLAETVWIEPLGFARCAWPLLDAPDEIALRALAAVLRAVGGSVYPLRLDGLERLFAALCASRHKMAGWPRTLAGCLVRPSGDGNGIVVAREPAVATDQARLQPGDTAIWDSRFAVSLAPDAPAAVIVRAVRDVATVSQIRAWLAAERSDTTLSATDPVVLTLPVFIAGDTPVLLPSHDLAAPGTAWTSAHGQVSCRLAAGRLIVTPADATIRESLSVW